MRVFQLERTFGFPAQILRLPRHRSRRDVSACHTTECYSSRSHTPRKRGWSTAECLRGLGGPELRELIRDGLELGVFGLTPECAVEYRKQFLGGSLMYGPHFR